MSPEQDTATTTKARAEHRPTIVKNAASSHFSAVDLARRETVGRLGDGLYPHTAVFHPDGRHVYLLYISSAHLEVVDLDRLETVQRLEGLGTAPVGSALGPDADHLFVGTASELPGSDDPGVIALALDDDATASVAAERPLGRCAGMRIGPRGRLLAAQKRDGSVVALSADAELAVEKRFPTGEKPHDMYELSDDLVAVNNADESYVTFIDAAGDSVACHAETGENPHGFGVADGPGYRYALVPAREDHRVAVVDLDAVAAGDDAPTEALVDVGTQTGFVDATPGGRYALVDSYEEPRVTILDLERLAVAGEVHVPGEPLHVVMGRDGDVCYVGNMDRPEIAVLDTAPLRDDRPGDVELVDRIEGLGEKPSGIFRPEGDR